jgi:hypothetical protein
MSNRMASLGRKGSGYSLPTLHAALAFSSPAESSSRSSTSPIAILAVMTARAFTPAGRFSPLGIRWALSAGFSKRQGSRLLTGDRPRVRLKQRAAGERGPTSQRIRAICVDLRDQDKKGRDRRGLGTGSSRSGARRNTCGFDWHREPYHPGCWLLISREYAGCKARSPPLPLAAKLVISN